MRLSDMPIVTFYECEDGAVLINIDFPTKKANVQTINLFPSSAAIKVSRPEADCSKIEILCVLQDPID